MRHLLIFQNGSYAEAHARFAAGEPETYREQRASVAYVEGLSKRYRVTTLALCPEAHDRVLTPTLRSVGVLRGPRAGAELAAHFAKLEPDIVVARAPYPAILGAVARRGVPTLPCFADLFSGRGLKHWWRTRRLRRLLSGPHLPCVANHSLNASRSAVQDLGLPASRVVPWDWAPLPVQGPARTTLQDPAQPRLFYAGALSADKGVGDVLAALALLSDAYPGLRMQFAGPGDLDHWRAEADRQGVATHVRFLGRISNDAVRSQMAASDIVLVPSRHSYPEGLPNVIYEGLASRSPLILSDHPAFAGRLTAGQDMLQFRAGDAADLARAVNTLVTEPDLYATLSARSEAALLTLPVGLEWQALVDLFLADPSDQSGWVARHALTALGY